MNEDKLTYPVPGRGDKIVVIQGGPDNRSGALMLDYDDVDPDDTDAFGREICRRYNEYPEILAALKGVMEWASDRGHDDDGTLAAARLVITAARQPGMIKDE